MLGMLSSKRLSCGGVCTVQAHWSDIDWDTMCEHKTAQMLLVPHAV
jgi:hypothetical protein